MTTHNEGAKNPNTYSVLMAPHLVRFEIAQLAGKNGAVVLVTGEFEIVVKFQVKKDSFCRVDLVVTGVNDGIGAYAIHSISGSIITMPQRISSMKGSICSIE